MKGTTSLSISERSSTRVVFVFLTAIGMGKAGILLWGMPVCHTHVSAPSFVWEETWIVQNLQTSPSIPLAFFPNAMHASHPVCQNSLSLTQPHWEYLNSVLSQVVFLHVAENSQGDTHSSEVLLWSSEMKAGVWRLFVKSLTLGLEIHPLGWKKQGSWW